jgi:hypothetical protein
MPESPLWAIKAGQSEKAKAIMLRMMKANKVDCAAEIESIDQIDIKH